MPLILWTESLSVKVKIFDEQHRGLMQHINELHDAVGAGKGTEVLDSLLDALVAYTKDHLALEEKYFVEFDYPDKERHSKEHQMFIRKVQEFKNQLRSGRKELILPVMKFLSDWLLHHIQETDMAYADFLNERGVR